MSVSSPTAISGELEQFDFAINGTYYADLSDVPPKYHPALLGAVEDARTTRREQLAAMKPGERLRIEINGGRQVNFAVAEDFSVTWNGVRYTNYHELPRAAKDALVDHPTFPDLNDDGIPDLFEGKIPADPDLRRDAFKARVRANREAQRIAAASPDHFAPDYPGFERATFNFDIDGVIYPSLVAVPEHLRVVAQRLIVDFLQNRADNRGGPLTSTSVVRLRAVDTEQSGPNVTQKRHAPEPAEAEPNAVYEYTNLESAASPVEVSSGNMAAIVLFTLAATAALTLVVAIVLILGAR